jgi:hypothetical protein
MYANEINTIPRCIDDDDDVFDQMEIERLYIT